MDDNLIQIAKDYQSTRDFKGNIKDVLYRLYERYIKEREQTLMEAAAASAAVNALFLSDQIDFSKVTPQMEEAFKLAYPNTELISLSERSPEEVQGFLSAWKGKYFEVMVGDKLNAGEWVGDIHLEPGQVAQLAESATQPGWDLQILNADGTVANELQLKATESLSYVKSALERYPDIDVITTDEVLDSAGDLSNQFFPSGISDEALEEAVLAPMEEVLDSPLEELVENILPGLPFIIIAVSEGRKVMIGRKTFEMALSDGLERTVKTGAAIGVGALVYFLDGGLLSIPASFLTRVGFNRYKTMSIILKELRTKIDVTRKLLPYYSKAATSHNSG